MAYINGHKILLPPKIDIINHTFIDTTQKDIDKILDGTATHIKSGVTNIKGWNSATCTSLVEVDLPNITEIKESQFISLNKLETVIAPKVQMLGMQSFRWCEALKSAKFPEALSLGAMSFYGCSSLEEAEFPKLPVIEYFTFLGCSNLKSFDFSSTERIGEGAFQNCVSLNFNKIRAVTIEKDAFYGCSSLTEITFTNKPQSIHESAFLHCTNLLTINVPWGKGEVAGDNGGSSPWGASKATVNYNYKEE